MANGMQVGLVLADSKGASYRSTLGRVIQSDFKTPTILVYKQHLKRGKKNKKEKGRVYRNVFSVLSSRSLPIKFYWFFFKGSFLILNIYQNPNILSRESLD